MTDLTKAQSTGGAEEFLDSPAFTVSGSGDWDDLVDEATSLHEERIVINMGRSTRRPTASCGSSLSSTARQ